MPRRLPSIAVIVATLNAAPALRRTLQSISGQDYPDLEVIVVDGGSTDDSSAVIAASPCAIAQAVSEPDRGIADAYNKGIRLATSDWIFFLNADDVFYDSGVLRRTMESSGDGMGVDLVIGKVEADSGRLFNGRLGVMLCVKNTVHHQGIFYRRSYLTAHPYNTQYRRYGHDHEHNLAMWLAGVKVGYVDTIVVLWATGGISDDARWKDYCEEFNVRRNTLGPWAIAFDSFTPIRFAAKRLKKLLFERSVLPAK